MFLKLLRFPHQISVQIGILENVTIEKSVEQTMNKNTKKNPLLCHKYRGYREFQNKNKKTVFSSFHVTHHTTHRCIYNACNRWFKCNKNLNSQLPPRITRILYNKFVHLV